MTESNLNDELWRVQLATGEIRTMTLDTLDRAFDEGVIDASSPVLLPGASTWTTLGEAAGLSDVGPAEPIPSLAPVAVAPPSSVPPRGPVAQPLSQLDLELPDLAEQLSAHKRRGPLLAALGGLLAVVVALAVFANKLGESAPVDVRSSLGAKVPTQQALAPPAAVETPPRAAEATGQAQATPPAEGAAPAKQE
ncbi:MAG TPA: hypothetical protein VM580_09075, partial [Labilithrix sp.]|nr:hypothetical protein [Labilithrix sp.]